jgi:hypothetical protein
MEIPFVWPDSRKLAGCVGPAPDLDALLAESQLVLGIVHGVTEATVSRLGMILEPKPVAVGNGNGHLPEAPIKKIRLIVTLYPTCPTRTETLRRLLNLQKAHPSLEVKLATCGLLSGPENTLACYKKTDAIPTVLLGTSASLEAPEGESSNLTLAFTPEPILASEWAKWFDVRWLKAVRLTEQRVTIPHLVLPEGTLEAAQQWAAYERLCVEDSQDEEAVEVTVDPATGEVSAKDADGNPVKTVSADNKLPKVSPVYRKLAQLFDMGHLVSVDKTTRLLPFEVSVKPKWFGMETLTQIGSVKRQVSYRISALTEDELKQLENRRKKTSELLDLFSFSLADGQRWMPVSAEGRFHQENNRINTEALGIFSKLIAGDLEKFLAERRKSVKEDASRMYRDLFPDRTLSEDAINEIMSALRKRFEEAQQRSFLPQVSLNRVSLPQPQDSAWKSQLGSALHLLLSIVRYPRKASRNGPYFARGMSAKPQQILSAMNLLNDPFIEHFDKADARDRAEVELDAVQSIEGSDATAEKKCEQLFELLGHKIACGEAESSGHTNVSGIGKMASTPGGET